LGYVVLNERSDGGDESDWILRGDLVALGSLRHEHLQLFERWFNAPAIARGLSLMFQPLTSEKEHDWYASATNLDARSAHFTIYRLDQGLPIGNTALMGIDYANGTAQFGIAIGDATAHGHGFGTETTQLMLRFAFLQLSLFTVYLQVYEWNVAGYRAYQKAGFRVIGRRRGAFRLGRRRWDAVMMATHLDEWEPVSTTSLSPFVETVDE
jgi:RimJ/RimL family protein N-acetyltransferase